MGFSVRWRVESGLSTAYSGEAECGTVPPQNRRDATTCGIASCCGASMTLCRRSGVQTPGRHFWLTDRRFSPELVCANQSVEDDDEFPHRSREVEILAAGQIHSVRPGATSYGLLQHEVWARNRRR